MTLKQMGRVSFLVGVSLAALGGAAVPSFAQDRGTGAGAEQAIIVTGTRVQRDGYDAPTPLTVLTSEAIDRAAPANIADYVNQMPQLSPNSTPRVGIGATSTGTAGLSLLDLRGLGANRTLVLMDGQRIAPATQTGAVDLNNLPSVLVQRVDVVTGGASAAYGSDAVAGVVNFIIDKKFEGIKGSLVGGITDRGDNQQHQISLALGKSFAGGKGHILLSGELSHDDGIHWVDPAKRTWYNASYLVPNPAYVAGNGQPRQIVASNVNYNNVAQGGVITTTALRGTQFGVGGSPMPFNYGTIAGNFMIGGNTWNEGNVAGIAPQLDRTNIWGRVSYELTDSIRASIEGGYGRSHVLAQAAYQRYTGNLTISASNPFLPQSVRDRAANLGITSFGYGYSTFDLGQMWNDIVRENYRVVAALEGDFGDGWQWNAYYQNGRTNLDIKLRNTTNIANFNRAIDAVVNPANGQIVCRSTLTSPSNGCVPLNIFGIGVASPAAINYVKQIASQQQQIKQQVAAVSANGTPFDTWAGPVSVAFGAEHRTESANAVGDPVSVTNGFVTGNFKTNAGSYNVSEAFVETVVPLAKDMSFAKSLDFNGAIRVTDYSTSGTVVTWKAGLTYEPYNDLMLRAVLSRDIRAPSISELYLAGATQAVDVADPLRGNIVTRINQATDGNTELQPEKADTLSLGAVYRPSWLPGFSISLDYYKIKIKGAVATLPLNDIVNRCVAGDTALCGFITRDADNVITLIRRVPINVGALENEGIDIDATYRVPLDRIFPGAGGNLTMRALATNTIHYIFENNGVANEAAGENGGPNATPSIPKWRTFSSISYDDERLSVTGTMRTISAGVYDVTWTSGVDIDNNRIAGATYFDLAASYKLFKDDTSFVELFVKVDNLLDKDPPIAAGIASSALHANPVLYDVIGRAYRGGVRVRF